MEVLAAKSALAIGAEAIKVLNRWLKNKETAIAWFGKDRGVFVGRSLLINLKLRKVFVINQEDWEMVITLCLPACQTWYSQRGEGRCSWLPIYRAVTTRSSGTQFIQNPRAALLSIAAVSSLPAACIDKWGLVVLASADGGTVRLLENGEGSYRAIFDCRDFTLVISQETLNSMTVAHISPKQHPNINIYRLNEAEWKNLQNQGRSLAPNDPMLSWFGDPCGKLNPPPPELVDENGSMDRLIKTAIFDDQYAVTIRDHLRDAIYECHDLWKRLQRISDGTISTQEKIFILGETTEMRSNLLKMRMFLYTKSWNSFCEEMTPNDILHYAEQQYRCCKRQVNNSGSSDIMKELCLYHEQIFAFQKILHQSSIIPEQLSTRGTDTKVLLT